MVSVIGFEASELDTVSEVLGVLGVLGVLAVWYNAVRFPGSSTIFAIEVGGSGLCGRNGSGGEMGSSSGSDSDEDEEIFFLSPNLWRKLKDLKCM